jgi:hypothetical protein
LAAKAGFVSQLWHSFFACTLPRTSPESAFSAEWITSGLPVTLAQRIQRAELYIEIMDDPERGAETTTELNLSGWHRLGKFYDGPKLKFAFAFPSHLPQSLATT